MVDWDSKERGVRLGETAARGLILGCNPCHRWVRVEMRDALARFGSIHARDLARRLKCSECGERKGYVMVWSHTPGD